LVEDLNLVLYPTKEREGLYFQDKFQENMEEIIMDWDLMDQQSSSGKFT
jgi:hypothetical protein